MEFLCSEFCTDSLSIHKSSETFFHDHFGIRMTNHFDQPEIRGLAGHTKHWRLGAGDEGR